MEVPYTANSVHDVTCPRGGNKRRLVGFPPEYVIQQLEGSELFGDKVVISSS